MAHYERNLASAQSCGGDRGVYVGRSYFMYGNAIKMSQVDLGHFSHHLESASDLIKETAERLGDTLNLGEPLPVGDLVAVAVLRDCQRRRHIDGKQERGARLERIGSYLITPFNIGREAIRLASTRQQRKVSEHGFGRASRDTSGLVSIKNLIYLPTTPEENARYEVVSAQKAGPHVSALANQPYVALHTLPESGQSIEEVVTLDQLR